MKRLLPFVLFVLWCVSAACQAADRRIVLIAGNPSHGPGEHEHNAGVLLLQKCLDAMPGVKTAVHLNGWPEEEKFFDGADAIVLYMDGGGGHPATQGDHLRQLDALMKKGVGLACLHYAVEPTKERGQKEFLDWIGGAFEVNWSVNPHWDAAFKEFPKHPITQGVKAFTLNDEWYFNMRFRDGMKGVTPLLSAVPPETTMSRQDGPHEGNPAVRKMVKQAEPQHVAWACERRIGRGREVLKGAELLKRGFSVVEYSDGGRGFGFTGAHFHRNWGDENFRKLVLNAILWIAHADVPSGGVDCRLSADELKAHLDPKDGSKKN